MARIRPHIRQYQTHRDLVGGTGVRTGAVSLGAGGLPRVALDAIVVPASRPAANLDHAVTLARATHSRLVVLCSQQARAADVEELLAARSFSQATVVDLPPGYSHPLLGFRTSALMRAELPEGCVNPNRDLSTKRNLGLILSRMLDWNRFFFMDDDIRDLESADLYAAVSMLEHYRSVGMRVTDFPDNSVVCHAHRVTGGPQDVFVSGSVLAVNCAAPAGFFPDIYNEDWLFFYDDARRRQLAWSGRNATQLQYDPFDDPRRAERQEFGDILAEGLYALLHQGGGPADATCGYWNVFLDERRRFLQHIHDRSHPVAPDIRGRLVAAVETAMMCLMEIQPRLCERYVRTWREDLRVWQEDLEKVSRVDSPEAALRELELTPTVGAQFIGLQKLGPAEATRMHPPGPVHIPHVTTLSAFPGIELQPEFRFGRAARGRHRRQP